MRVEEEGFNPESTGSGKFMELKQMRNVAGNWFDRMAALTI
jgi:hypothetical protein